MRRTTREGFTLIELLTVIAIIGILAAVLIPAAMGVQRRAKAATSQTTLSGWCSGIIRYKQFYGFYPNFTGSTYPAGDSIYRLESSTATAAYFVMALSGKHPSGQPLSTGLTGFRATYNRASEAFVDFSRDDFEAPTALSAVTASTASLGAANYLVDRFGNRNIRVVIDYDGSGIIKSPFSVGTAPAAAAVPADIASYITTTGYPARVLIYTSRTDVNALDYGASQPAAGTAQADFLDVIAAQ